MDKKWVIPVYKRFPVLFVKGRGVNLWDGKGKSYLDFFSGLAVNNLGHLHPRIVQAIKRQAENLLHTSNLYYTMPQARLAAALGSLSFNAQAFFCNSGAEANEAAIKLARKWGAPRRFEIITMCDSFHGRTMATITATAQRKYQEGLAPLVPGFKYVPLNNLPLLKKAITSRTVAIMLEPIQGEGGINVCQQKYLKAVRKLCNEKGLLLILDEVQTGIGRTGKMFAYQHYGITPDILTLAKAIGGGLPLGVMLSRRRVARAFNYGAHASTFGGNPLICQAALATLETIKKEGLLKKACASGEYLSSRLLALKEKFSFIREVRGMGLIWGMEIDGRGEKIVQKCLARGLLINCTKNNVLRFLPPLIIGKKDIDQMIGILDRVLREVKSPSFPLCKRGIKGD